MGDPNAGKGQSSCHPLDKFNPFAFIVCLLIKKLNPNNKSKQSTL